ncbi:MAG: hypothetical protein V7K48_07215 [Nostoc sp.]|uniref:hypothetical protein n=1 Tax=Nostoc sp. TaxID=1180 RepID=UPI002FF5A9F9
MKILLFCKDAGRSLLIRRGADKQANATVQILGYLITKEIYLEGCTLVYRAVRYVDQFAVTIKQSREAFISNFVEILNLLCAQAASLENAGFYQQARSQLVQNEKMSVLGNLAAEAADKINNLVGLNKRQESREQGARGTVQVWIRPHLLRQLPALYKNHLLEVGDSDLCSTTFVGRSLKSFPPASSLNAVNLQPAAYEVFHVRS